jgi:Retrotransposon gag protein
MNAWQALEAEFKKVFIDYAMHKRAQNELRKLRMKEGNMDEYIAAFQLLGHHVGVDLNDPSVLCLFAQGLPKSLAKSCIDIKSPENFEQWTSAAQRQQRNWLRKQALRSDYALPRPQQQGSNCGGFFWRCGNQGNAQPARPRLQPHDPNAMDTSAVACKATTKTEKEKYQKEGWCFECRKQGHMVPNILGLVATILPRSHIHNMFSQGFNWGACPKQVRITWPLKLPSSSGGKRGLAWLL